MTLDQSSTEMHVVIHRRPSHFHANRSLPRPFACLQQQTTPPGPEERTRWQIHRVPKIPPLTATS